MTRRRAAVWALPLMGWAGLLSAQGLPGFRELMERVGVEAPVSITPPPSVPPQGPAEDPELDALEKRVNFSYGEMTSRLEKIVIGRSRRRTGAEPADRVEKGGIRYIVIHSACGAYDGIIDHLLRNPVAAHFVVGKSGDVTRMVAIKNLARHVKNPVIEAASVGIETETGIPKAPWFVPGDWDPGTRWRMYASLAWVIRAVAKEAGVPRDTEHIIGHVEADRGIPGAHTDPGDYFYKASYPLFEDRFPGQGVTPQKYLMMLVNDDAPPRVERSTASAGAIRVRDLEHLGVSRVRVLPSGDAAAKPVHAWAAGPKGMPPFRVEVPAPAAPGDYQIEAYDLVGNMTRAALRVSGESPGALSLTLLDSPP